MSTCHICRSEMIKEILDFGNQPVCNRFLGSSEEQEYAYPMKISQCDTCGLIQIIDPVPAGQLLPPYSWITYNEPEGHLDQMVEVICTLPGITEESVISGISFKDDSTLKRLEKRGFKHTWRTGLKDDLGISEEGAGVETIQAYFTTESVNMMVKKYGMSDVVIVRHIFEHAHNAIGFMESLRQIVKPGGYVVFEVPDFTQSLEKFDYTAIWEEHVLYFTPETFRHCFAFCGFSPVRFECYPYPSENSLIGIVQPGAVTPSFPSQDVLDNEKRRAQYYSKEFPKWRDRFKKFFSEYRREQGRIALLGAGHLACKFLNLNELKAYIEFVVDDNPDKHGLFMPGSRVPIRGSDALLDHNIRLCLLSVSSESEEKVINSNKSFVEQGGRFLSIFPNSKYALPICPSD